MVISCLLNIVDGSMSGWMTGPGLLLCNSEVLEHLLATESWKWARLGIQGWALAFLGLTCQLTLNNFCTEAQLQFPFSFFSKTTLLRSDWPAKGCTYLLYTVWWVWRPRKYTPVKSSLPSTTSQSSLPPPLFFKLWFLDLSAGCWPEEHFPFCCCVSCPKPHL